MEINSVENFSSFLANPSNYNTGCNKMMIANPTLDDLQNDIVNSPTPLTIGLIDLNKHKVKSTNLLPWKLSQIFITLQ